MSGMGSVIKSKSQGRLKAVLTNYLLLFILAIIFIVFSIVLQDTYPTQSNIMTFLRQGSIYGSIILGVTWVLAADEMDVSFPDIAAFSSVLTAVLMNNGMSIDVAAFISIGCGALFGILNGVLVTKFKLKSLIVTIAVSGVAKAMALILGVGTTVPIQKAEGTMFYSIIWGDFFGVPVIFIAVVIMVIVMMIVQERTKFGQYIYAIGDNKEAAEVAGININSILRKVFVISGVFAAFGGVMLMLMVNSGQPTIGSTIFLDSFTKLFLGAMLFKIGKTNVFGTLVGAILLAMLVNGLTQLGTPSYISQIVTGALLIVGVTITSLLKRRRQHALMLNA
jgi:ribose transport system permease protein